MFTLLASLTRKYGHALLLWLLLSPYAASLELPPIIETQFGSVLISTEYTISGNKTPPVNSVWHSINMPHTWTLQQQDPPSSWHSLWYKFKIPEQYNTSATDGIYIDRALQNLVVYFNNDLLGTGGKITPPVSRNWNKAHLFKVPSSSWQTGENYLYIRIIGEDGYGVVSPPIVGDYSSLKQGIYSQKTLIRTDIARACFTITLMASLFGFLLWLRSRQATLLYASLAAMTWQITVMYFYWQTAPFAHDMFVRLTHLSLDASLLLLLLFVRAKYLLPLSMVRAVVIFYLIAVAIILFTLPPGIVIRIANLMHLITLPILIGCIAYVGTQVWRHRSLSDTLLFIGLSSILGFIAHDISLSLAYQFSSDWEAMYIRSHIAYMSLSVTFILICLSLSSMFRQYLAATKSLNKELSGRIQEMKQNLSKQLEKREKSEARRERELEREQVYSDLHDDLGAKLLSLVYASDNAVTSDLARGALQDLRDVVSSGGREPMHAEAFLADAMAEQQTRCDKLTVKFDHDSNEVPDGISYSATQTLLITRLIRELISVSLHQLSANEISLRNHIGHSGLELVLALKTTASLQDLSSLETRIHRLGGQLRSSEKMEIGHIHLICWVPHKPNPT